MDARLQRRIQRYGWDLAAACYEPLWARQLAPAHAAMLAAAPPAPVDGVLDVACGAGAVALAAAKRAQRVLGVDVSERMVDVARQRAAAAGATNAAFERMDGERLALDDATFDLAYCGLGLMYMPDALQAMRELHRVLRPGGRLAVAVWGERARCGWSPVFQVVDAEVASEVCPLFFQLGHQGVLAALAKQAGLVDADERRLEVVLEYASAEEAADAALVGGPVAMAWSRFDDATRRRVRERYLADIAAWRDGSGYRLPGEFVILSARKPGEVP
jgi:ubiquinone/menaquinone biosynthesis C-methylase UbiE